ncbi:MAG TPA: condensation domain-containing protein, partial [Pyrinomonadaceae bacterium]|nr:condensation domain-containing protein [Pyrinomonadaceae bacterium]
KVDRRALPAPEPDRPELEAEYVAARTPTEEIMVGIWAEVMGLERVGIHDSFFELGGHSLLGTQVMSRVREAFKVEIPLKSLFESPTVAELSAHVAAAQNAGWQLDMPPIVSSPRVEGAPLSFAQSRMWFHYQMEPESALYNIAVAIRIKGALDAAALEESLQEIVRRHETLRTTFDTLNDQPVQIIAPEMPLPLPITDLSGLAPSERETEVRRLKKAEGARPFDFARGPLIRAGLLRLDANEHVLLLTMHHIISDGWSLGILIREVVQFYEAFSRQQPANFAEPLRVQYGDFARWQRQALQGERLEKLLSYWKRQLSGLSPVLDLPTDRPRPVIQSYKGARQSRKMPVLLTERLRKLARQEGVTQFVLLLAAFKLLLHRYTGQTDIGVGVGIANRTRVETENLIGFFANTLVLRSDLSGNPTFRELLTSERAVALDGYAHQDLPFEKLVEELQPERSLNHMPLFQVMFSMQNVPLPELELPGITLNIEEHEDETSKFDLMLSVSEAEQQLAFTFEYSTDLFEAATINRMFEHFQTLLTHIVEDADRPLSDLPLMTEEEQQRVLVHFNDTYTEFPRHLAIHQLFEERARHTPDAPALLAHEASDSLTYGELNERANRLAHHLRARGVATEVRVGVCLERSVDLIVSLLAILKAGGVYVPLDPAYPAARLALMVEDAGAGLVITRKTWAAAFEGMQGVRELISLDREQERIASHGAENPGCKVWPDNLAYVMYTSGSTGRPKGVDVTHRNVLRLVCNTNYVSFSPEEVFLQFAPISFDASTFEVWGSLLNGGRLALAPAGALSLAELGEVITRHGVTTLWL